MISTKTIRHRFVFDNPGIKSFILIIIFFAVFSSFAFAKVFAPGMNLSNDNINKDTQAIIDDSLSSVSVTERIDFPNDTNYELNDPYKFIPLNEFFYADNQRYTISGGLPLKESDLKILPTVLFGAGLTAVFVAQHNWQLQTIWKERGDFKFMEDIKQDFFVDKFGHMYGSYMASYIFSETLMECGLSYDAASLWGAGIGLSYSTYIEILDGFGTNWGFSPSDFYSDVFGAAFFIGQHYIPYLQNFTPKFMYFPADWHGDKPRMPHDMFNDDYSSQTFWLSVNIYNMLPENLKSYWLPWLQISFGYTARNILDVFHYPELKQQYEKIADVRSDIVWGSPRFIIALDYDLVKIIPDTGGFWNWLRQSVNLFKLPSPAIEFSKSKTRFYLVYPFSINF